nr:MAG TPA: GDSL like Lipase Acylhydrolase [Caudoviricetes sp.]
MVTEIVDLDLGSNPSFKILTMEGDICSRFIEFHLSYNGEVFNLQNKSVKCRYINDKTTEEVNLVINDYVNGVCTLEMPYRVTSTAQNAKCELVIHQYGAILSTIPFSVEVAKSLVKRATVESSNEFGALNNALWKVDGLDSRINSLSSQLDNNTKQLNDKFDNLEMKKANIEDVNSKVWSMANMGQDVKEAMTGGSVAVVGENTVLKENIVDGQVIKSKTSFYKKTRNLFDKEKATYGKYISSTTGEASTPSSDGTFYASDFINVTNGSKYNYRAEGNSYTLYAFYNSSKTFVSGGNVNGTDIISPVDGYIRVSVWKNVDINTVQFEQGEATEYIAPYVLAVEEDVSEMKNNLDKIMIDQIYYSDYNRNVFNPNTVLLNKQVSPNTGLIVDTTVDGTFYASDFINVKGHSLVYCIKNDFTTMFSNYAFYSDDKTYISGGSREINGVSIPSNASYIRFTVWKDIVPSNVMIELDGLNSFIKFDDNSRNQEFYLTKMKFKDIIINCIGDSITYGFLTSSTRMQSPYPTSLKALLSAKDVRNYGLSGTTVANDRTVMGSFEPMSSPTRVSTWDSNANVNIILGGVNDFIKNVELGTIDDEVDTTFYGGYKSLIKQLYTKYPNAKIVMMTPLHYSLEYTPNTKGYILKDYVNAIREIAEMYGIYLIDLYAICNININTRGKYQVDGLHTNQYYVSNIMVQQIAEGLKRIVI